MNNTVSARIGTISANLTYHRVIGSGTWYYGRMLVNALNLLQVLHDEIIASVLQELFLEMLRRMEILAGRLGSLTSTLSMRAENILFHSLILLL
jgi:hypothetical protein